MAISPGQRQEHADAHQRLLALPEQTAIAIHVRGFFILTLAIHRDVAGTDNSAAEADETA